MADIHNALKRSIVADAVKKAIGQHRQGEGGLERWSETLQPVMNPWGMPEWAFLRAERLGACKSFAAAVAAEFSIIGLCNPAASNTIVVVEGVSGEGGSNVTAQLEVVAHSVITGTVVSTPGLASARDRRWLNNVGRAFLCSGTDATNTFGVPLEQQGFTTTIFNPFQSLPVILKPGDDAVVIAQTVNISLAVNWVWRERQAFPGELA